MGADLVASVLEIEKQQEPNWAAAKKFLDHLTDDECINIVCDVDCCLKDDVTANGARRRLKQALGDCQSGWQGDMRGMMRFDGAKTNMLIAGDRTWGDPVDEVTSMSLLVESGVAKVAGFLVRQ